MINVTTQYMYVYVRIYILQHYIDKPGFYLRRLMIYIFKCILKRVFMYCDC